MKIAEVVTIKSLRKLFKQGEEALSIELANVEEHGYDIVVGKGLYNVGDKAVYIQPDYCVPLPIEEYTLTQKLFIDFTKPQGEEKKSKLGKSGRIRAVKFNFSTDPMSIDPTYSMGIMIPLNEVNKIMNTDVSLIDDLAELLDITKYEEPETASSGLNKGSLPSGMYKTDETTIENQLRILERILPTKLTGSLKIDGSSITLYYKNENEFGICSRGLEKNLEQTMVVGYINGDDKLRKHFDKENNKNGWFSEKTNTFYENVPTEYESVSEAVDDTFVKLGMPILNKLIEYCKTNNKSLALRGELCGFGLKGSGNKNNPHSNQKQTIKFYGLDNYELGRTIKSPLTEFYSICELFDLEVCDKVFEKEFSTYDEIKEECKNYFKTNMIEGIVLRNESCTFSAKLMNLEYDSKK